MENSRDVIFLLGGKDLEMEEIRKLLEGNNIPFIDKGLSWGADLSAYSEDLNNIGIGTIYGVELSDNGKIAPDGYVRIDHHNDFSDREAAIKQVADIIGVELTRDQLLVAANDSGYIPAMLSMGATSEEISDIRRRDRAAQGVTEKEERLAKEALSHMLKFAERDTSSFAQKHGPRPGSLNSSLVIIRTSDELSHFSPITDDLYGKKHIIIYNQNELCYYGLNAHKFGSEFDKEVKSGRMYFGGSPTSGYFGTSSNKFSFDDLEALVEKLAGQIIPKDKILKINVDKEVSQAKDVEEEEYLYYETLNSVTYPKSFIVSQKQSLEIEDKIRKILSKCSGQEYSFEKVVFFGEKGSDKIYLDSIGLSQTSNEIYGRYHLGGIYGSYYTIPDIFFDNARIQGYDKDKLAKVILKRYYDEQRAVEAEIKSEQAKNASLLAIKDGGRELFGENHKDNSDYVFVIKDKDLTTCYKSYETNKNIDVKYYFSEDIETVRDYLSAHGKSFGGRLSNNCLEVSGSYDNGYRYEESYRKISLYKIPFSEAKSIYKTSYGRLETTIGVSHQTLNKINQCDKILNTNSLDFSDREIKILRGCSIRLHVNTMSSGKLDAGPVKSKEVNSSHEEHILGLITDLVHCLLNPRHPKAEHVKSKQELIEAVQTLRNEDIPELNSFLDRFPDLNKEKPISSLDESVREELVNELAEIRTNYIISSSKNKVEDAVQAYIVSPGDELSQQAFRKTLDSMPNLTPESREEIFSEAEVARQEMSSGKKNSESCGKSVVPKP